MQEGDLPLGKQLANELKRHHNHNHNGSGNGNNTDESKTPATGESAYCCNNVSGQKLIATKIGHCECRVLRHSALWWAGKSVHYVALAQELVCRVFAEPRVYLPSEALRQ